jgi:hypothetical protein
MKINSQYYSDVARAFVSPTLVLGAQFSFAGYPRGATLSDAAVQALVADAMAPGTPGALTYDAAAMYIVLTSSDVALPSGFCTSYCGWHTASNVLGRHTRFGFVGNAARCPTACAGLTQNTAPNGNLGADAMASILMHEIVEVLTDPDLDGCVLLARVRRVSAACMLGCSSACFCAGGTMAAAWKTRTSARGGTGRSGGCPARRACTT